MLFTSGYWQRGEFERVPLRWHWTLLAGLAIASRWEFRPVAWLLYLGLVQVHLMAHGWSVRKAGQTPIGFDIQGLGGKVRWNGVATPAVQIRHAWVGVLAQSVLWAGAGIALAVHGPVPVDTWLEDLQFVWRDMNLVMVAVNLLPLPTFDGENAWRVFELSRGRDIPQRRMIIIEVAKADEKPPRAMARQVELDIAEQLADLARAHNARAKAQDLSATRAPAGTPKGDPP
jgi:hypothetical protein